MTMHRGGRVAGAAALSLVCGGTSALAGPGAPPSYGHDFVTITHAGNRPALNSERFYGYLGTFPTLGQVNNEYRISRTETTVRQWFDFVNVAWPFAQAQGFNTRFDSRFIGGFIEAANANPNAPPNYYIPGPDPFGRYADNVPTSMSLRFAAWYTNWTHHGQPTTNVTLETFTTGAYTVTANSLTREAGARYWIPSLHEWTKAVYYDPNRYAPGTGPVPGQTDGYWPYSGMSLTPLVGGPPGTPGAQSSTGGWYLPGTFGLPPDVGSYPQTLSPWGLLDTSGGQREYTDTPDWYGRPSLWHIRGEGIGTSISTSDQLDYAFFTTSLDSGAEGLRIASLVPTPAAVIVLGCFGIVAGRRLRME